MNRKARRRAIWLLERRRLLRDSADGRVAAADPFRFSLAYGAETVAGNPLRVPTAGTQTHSAR